MFLGAPGGARAADPVVRFSTSLGAIDVQLLPAEAPRTVENFLGYVSRRAYDGSFFHRSVTGFVIQGGGYTGDVQNPVATADASTPTVVNEFRASNVRGTLAMAKNDSGPDTAKNEWFFNQSDQNASNLDTQNGGFTVFGRIRDAEGLRVMDAIAALPTRDKGAPFTALPVRGNPLGTTVTAANLVVATSVAVLPAAPASAPGPQPVPVAPPTPRPATAPPPRPRPAPFRLTTRSIAVPTLGRAATRLRVRVYDLPPRTRVRATIIVAGRARTATATATVGRARLSLAITPAVRAALRRRGTSVLQVRVTATPPGARASRAAALVIIR